MGLDNISLTSDDLLSIGPLGENFNKMQFRMSSAEYRSFFVPACVKKSNKMMCLISRETKTIVMLS